MREERSGGRWNANEEVEDMDTRAFSVYFLVGFLLCVYTFSFSLYSFS